MNNRIRVLVALWDGGGTVPPELAIVRALVESGDDVTVIADAVLADDVTATGAAHVPWTTAPQHTTRHPEDDFVQEWRAKNPLQTFAIVRDRFLCGPAALYAHDVVAQLEQHPADVVVASEMLLGAHIGAEAAGLPLMLLCPNIYALPRSGQPPFGTGWMPARGPLGRGRDRVFGRLMERMFDSGLDTLNSARATYELAPLEHSLDQVRKSRTLVLMEPAFDFPATFPDTVSYAGAQLDDPSWSAPWSPPAGDDPLVLVAMSSTFQRQVPALQRVIAALGTLPVRGVVTCGPAVDPAELEAPANVQVVESAPHSEILRHASAVITHGGHGTVVKSLAAGVPMLVLPMGRDQGDNAARVVAHGAGLRLSRSAGQRRIARSLRELLDETSFRSSAEQLGAAVRAGAGPRRAVDEIHDLALNGTPTQPHPGVA